MQAERRAANHRARMKAYGRWEPFTDPGPARDWVLMLGAFGIGWRRVARLAGVSDETVSRLLYEKPPRPVRTGTAAKIMAVRPVLANAADLARVGVTGSRRRLQALVAVGWPQRWLAARLGWAWTRFSAVMNRQERISAAHARAVLALYAQLWDQPPPQATKAERRAVTRARQLAQRQGWPSPQGWDDDAIDDPAATPQQCRRRPGRRRQAVLIADAEELMASPAETITGQGLTRQLAADRLGVSREVLEKALSRHAHAARAGSREAA